MALTQSQRTIIEKARALGAGEQGIELTDAMCACLAGIIANDLGLSLHFPELPKIMPSFFSASPLRALTCPGLDFIGLFERLISLNPDADTYFACLAALHKARLKYEKILETQPIPTLEQIGPRSLLQYGQVSAKALAGLLFWRKWFYDIDNRAAQETGYLFEPIIAHAIGGTPASATRSPIKRHAHPSKNRQVDCIRDKRAYEFKLRVTIAASGQGRWSEELDFPVDCRASGYTPILIVLDSTSNPKLNTLSETFLKEGGEFYSGSDAWRHLESIAGPTMASFLEKYIRIPLQSLLANETQMLPKISAEMGATDISISVADETFVIDRSGPKASLEEPEDFPEDSNDAAPGL